jgi:ABC-type transport system involved in multi-copper enzyme maturation permease subunit
MTFLPIVERELIEASRRRGTYWIRLAAAGVGVLIGGWMMLVMRGERPWELGQAMLIATSIAVYLYCLFVGVFRTADCLSEEKREGTLGLLFLTDLKGYDIVFGKLVASSLNAFYGILAIFPVMAIPLLLGGVTLSEFWRIVLVAVNTLFFSLATGMFCSAISRDERRSMVVAFLIVLFFAAGFPLLAGFCHEWRPTRPIAEYLLVPSPGYAAVMAFEAPFTKSTFNHFHASVIFTHVLSWAFLIAASFIVPRTWQDRALTTGQVKRREKLNEFQLGSAGRRRAFRARLLEVNPFYWLLARHRTKPFAVWAFLGLVALVWAIGLSNSPRAWRDDWGYLWTAVIVHTVLKFWMVTESCRRFSSDRQSGALELLLSTPITVKELVRGQILALERQFAGPLFVVLLMDFVFLLAGRHDSDLLVVWIAGMVIFVADIVALAWVGMWRGLNSRRPNRAAAAAMVRVLVLPWMIFLLLLTLAAVTDAFGRRMGNWDGKSAVYLWATISLLVNAYFAIPARRRLLKQFRSVATTRFDAGTGKDG